MRPGWTAAGLAALYAAGVAHWLLFFGLAGGGLSFTVADWPKEFRYYSALQQAVSEGRVPYYVSRPIHETRKLLSLPEVSWSPQVLLLRVVDIGPFVALNTVLLYSAGFAGCLLIRRRYRLGLLPFAFLFLLLFFNGHITSHLAAGHSMWGGYFLLPFFFLLVLASIEDGGPAATSRWLALLLFAVLLQGSFHLFVWCVLFLLLLAAFHKASRRAVGRTFLWAGALGACRLVPSAVVLLGRRDQSFLSGYPTPLDLLEALTVIRTVREPKRGGWFGELDWWEYDAYIGVFGLAWLLYFGLYRRLRDPEGREGHRHRELDRPLAAMALLSLSELYYPLNALPLPLLASQRVSSRLIILPLGFLVVLAAVRMQATLQASLRRRAERWLAAGGAALTAVSLAIHSRVWWIPAVEAAWPPAPHPRDLAIELVSAPEAETLRDWGYLVGLKAAALFSLAALLALAWRVWKERSERSARGQAG